MKSFKLDNSGPTTNQRQPDIITWIQSNINGNGKKRRIGNEEVKSEARQKKSNEKEHRIRRRSVRETNVKANMLYAELVLLLESIWFQFVVCTIIFELMVYDCSFSLSNSTRRLLPLYSLLVSVFVSFGFHCFGAESALVRVCHDSWLFVRSNERKRKKQKTIITMKRFKRKPNRNFDSMLFGYLKPFQPKENRMKNKRNNNVTNRFLLYSVLILFPIFCSQLFW